MVLRCCIKLTAFSMSICYQLAASQLMSTGSTLALNGVPYYVPSTPFSSLPSFQSSILSGVTSAQFGLVPVTFVLENLVTTLDSFETQDDVWSTGFLPGTPSNFPSS